MDKIYLSTVTPVYRGAEVLGELVSELASVKREIAEVGGPLELIEAIFVDDSSIDDSSRVLAECRARHPWIKVVHLSRNFGQHPATQAGILHSSGDWVATLDEDLQHHPAFLLPLLFACVRGGNDVVYAQAQGGAHESLFRDISSRSYKSLMSRLTGEPNIRKFNSFRMMRGEVARAAAAVSAHEVYFDVALGWFTDRVATMPLPLKDRRYIAAGKSGYSLLSLLHHARRLLISSRIKYLRIGAAVGFGTLLVSLLLSVAMVVVKIMRPELIPLRGWTSLALAILFFGGLTSSLVGIALEYLSTLLQQALGKPSFFVVDRGRDETLLALAERYLDG